MIVFEYEYIIVIVSTPVISSILFVGTWEFYRGGVFFSPRVDKFILHIYDIHYTFYSYFVIGI